jgi:hypothetical protein
MRRARGLLALLVCAALWLPACGSGSGSGSGAGSQGDVYLSAVHYGRLADVYGLRRIDRAVVVDLYQADVLVGPDIQDERDANSHKPDHEITYDFIASNPDTRQPRLLITREIGSREFEAAYTALGKNLRLVTPSRFGQRTAQQPFTVVPRNAALQLAFAKDLGVGDDFFVTRDASGRVNGLKNTEAVQLLKIVGDPNDGQHTGDFQVLPCRVVVRGNLLLLDPVLLGTEGIQYQTRNNASGLPESPDQTGANIRIAVALEGVLRIPGIAADRVGDLSGRNNAQQLSVIRDVRSGNRNDHSSDIAKGFVRDPLPPRIAGEIVMYLERVDDFDDVTQIVTIYKAGIAHEIDRSDVLRFVTDNGGVPAAVTEVNEDPADDLGEPGVQHVRAKVRRTLHLEAIDPSNRPDYPTSRIEREPWLVRNAPRAVLVCEFTARRQNPVTREFYGDDPRHFLTFSPSPLPKADGSPSEPNQNVSPFAGAIVRFTKPVDLSTVKALDTFFFGTRDLFATDLLVSLQDQLGVQVEPATFRLTKFTTPHLVFARAFDEDGSQTALRLQPALGFYLDERIRQQDEGKPFAEKRYRYYLHLLSDKDGIKDLSGNAIDFQAVNGVQDSLVIPFSLDTRKNSTGQPLYGDNLAVTVARRFRDADEDEQPNYYLRDEVQERGRGLNGKALAHADLFGGVAYLTSGQLAARTTGRVRQIADDLNQAPPPAQGGPPNGNDLKHCPFLLNGEQQAAAATATTKFGQPLQNPLNPFGCRLQTVWREVDLSLSRTDPYDFNLDVEQLYWAPFGGVPITFDEFDRMTLYLGHSEWRPEPCVGAGSAFPSMTLSGLEAPFLGNYVHNRALNSSAEDGPPRHPAYVDQSMPIEQRFAFTEPNGVNRYLSLPRFQKPYFVWRDETTYEQGANARVASDVAGTASSTPYIISPFLNGGGRYQTIDTVTGLPKLNFGFWCNWQNFNLLQTSRQDTATGGLVGTIALPLLADFWGYPDSPTLPKDNPFRASGANGWQIAITVQRSPQPNFRVYSAGGLVQGRPITVDPTKPDWVNATGGYTPTGGRTIPSDNSFFWIMADFVKRQTVATAGFVEIDDPHRMTGSPVVDPRLGPYYERTGSGSRPVDVLPRFLTAFEPPLEQLPGGTAVIPEFRGAGSVDASPWYWEKNLRSGPFTAEKPDVSNFPLDPLKAGDAHIRHFDDRNFGQGARNGWTYFYNRVVTSYVAEPGRLLDPAFTSRFAAPNEVFRPQDVKYMNWRFLMRNNVEATPPVSPVIEAFVLAWRFERE